MIHLSFGGWYTPSLEGRVLEVIITACLVLLLITFAFAVLTLWLRWMNVRRERRWRRLEATWQNLVMGALGGDIPVQHVHEHVRRRDRLFFIGYLVRFARRLRGPELRTLGLLAEPYLVLVVRQAGERDPERRARAVQTLGLLAPERYPRLLIRALDDRSPLVAMVAARTLCSEERPENADPVLDHLHRFQSWDVSFLASMLASMGTQVAPRILAALVYRRRPAAVRAVAAEALERLNYLPAADAAAAVLGSAEDVDLLAAALRLVGRVGAAQHVEPVRRLVDHPAMPVRAAAVAALGRLGGPADVAQLRQALDDPSIWVAMHAARALKAVGAEAVLRAIVASTHARAGVALEALEEVAA